MQNRDASRDGSPKSKPVLFSDIDGVRGYCVGDTAGNIADDHLTSAEGATAVVVGAVVSHRFGEIGSCLGLGDVAMITARGETGSWLFAFREGHSIAVHLEANVSPTRLEAAVRDGAWLPNADWEVTDAEIEYVPPHEAPARETERVARAPRVSSATATPSKPASPRLAPPSLPAPALSRTAAASSSNATTLSKPTKSSAAAPLSVAPKLSNTAPIETRPPGAAMASSAAVAATHAAHVAAPSVMSPGQTPRPPAQRWQIGSGSSIPSPASPVRENGLKLAIANARGLRRAFARGDLKEARAIAEHLRHASHSPGDPCGSGTSAEAIEPLLAGIASTLFGDSKSALEHLITLTQRSDIGPSLTWIALVWCARASIASIDGLEQALTWAEAAGRLSKQLDVEARIVSARLVAEVCLHRSDLEHAEKFVEQARRMSESVADRDESGELSLLQAKILLASGKRPQAVALAERAHVFRQQWVSPILFLSRCAFGDGDLERVHVLIAPFHERDDTPTEISQVARLLTSARNADLPAASAAEFLELDEAPPSSTCIEQLEKLADAFPRIELIRDRLGWKLLKAGRYSRASELFEPLSQRRDLPDDVRASVLLALGYLAANRARHVSAGARVRASVDAAPGHLRSAKPPTTSSSRMRVAPIADLARIEPPPSAADPKQGGDPSVVPQFRAASPVFTGDLVHFCLPDVLEFLRAGRRTGTLLCSSVRGVGAIHLHNGLISGAAAPGTASLRDVLIASGKLAVDAAEKAVAIQQQAPAHLPIGTILLKQGSTSEEDIAGALRTQTCAAIAELLQWGDGLFAFDPEYGRGEPEAPVEIALDPQTVVLEIFKGMDERTNNLR